MLRTTMGRLLVNNVLPEDMRDHTRVIDGNSIKDLLREVAQRYPERYVDISHRLADIGRHAATKAGGHSFGLEHLQTAKVSLAERRNLEAKLAKILNNDNLTDAQRHELIVRHTGDLMQRHVKDVYNESLKEENPLALQVLSGSRGNPMNLVELRGTGLLFTDQRNRVIPVPILHNYSEGLTPAEYWASTYGARQGIMATKFATQDAGFLSKQLNQVSHRLVVVDEDDPRMDPTPRGMPVAVDDMDNEGALLARDVAGYKRNTVLTPRILKDIKSRGHARILVRSPVVGGSPDGGVYSRDVGVREFGTLPGRGEQVGLTAAQALSEPLSQAQLGAKHSGGVVGTTKSIGGFAYINQLIQTPERFKGGASHAKVDGTVERLEKAPAGGHYLWINGEKHYVASGFEPKVKKGDTVEAGDLLSDGAADPSLVTHHKGIGEGRRVFVNEFYNAMKGAGLKPHRRNIELLARGLINHVRMSEENGPYAPGDVIPYSTMEHTYEPRDDHEIVRDPQRALGKYLEKPVLHYTIGTKVRPSVVKELEHFGITELAVHPDPPPFEAEMIRGMASVQHDPDFLTRMYGSGQKHSLLTAVHRGGSSNELGTSFVPSLARAVDFGRTGLVRQPQPGIKPDKAVSEAPKPAAVPTPPEKKTPTLSNRFAGLFKFSAVRPVQQMKNGKPVVLTGTPKLMRQTRQIKQADALGFNNDQLFQEQKPPQTPHAQPQPTGQQNKPLQGQPNQPPGQPVSSQAGAVPQAGPMGGRSPQQQQYDFTAPENHASNFGNAIMQYHQATMQRAPGYQPQHFNFGGSQNQGYSFGSYPRGGLGGGQMYSSHVGSGYGMAPGLGYGGEIDHPGNATQQEFHVPAWAMNQQSPTSPHEDQPQNNPMEDRYGAKSGEGVHTTLKNKAWGVAQNGMFNAGMWGAGLGKDVLNHGIYQGMQRFAPGLANTLRLNPGNLGLRVLPNSLPAGMYGPTRSMSTWQALRGTLSPGNFMQSARNLLTPGSVAGMARSNLLFNTAVNAGQEILGQGGFSSMVDMARNRDMASINRSAQTLNDEGHFASGVGATANELFKNPTSLLNPFNSDTLGQRAYNTVANQLNGGDALAQGFKGRMQNHANWLGQQNFLVRSGVGAFTGIPMGASELGDTQRAVREAAQTPMVNEHMNLADRRRAAGLTPGQIWSRAKANPFNLAEDYTRLAIDDYQRSQQPGYSAKEELNQIGRGAKYLANQAKTNVSENVSKGSIATPGQIWRGEFHMPWSSGS